MSILHLPGKAVTALGRVISGYTAMKCKKNGVDELNRGSRCVVHLSWLR